MMWSLYHVIRSVFSILCDICLSFWCLLSSLSDCFTFFKSSVTKHVPFMSRSKSMEIMLYLLLSATFYSS